MLLLVCLVFYNFPTYAESVNGTIKLRPYTRDFEDLASTFQIVVMNVDGNTFETKPDESGRFGFPEVDPDETEELSWNRSQISEYVIWPLTHVQQNDSPFNGFRFQPIYEVTHLAKNNVFRAITLGKYDKAHDVVNNIWSLYERFEDPNNPSMFYEYKEKEYTFLREVCNKAAAYRKELDSDDLTDEIIQKERKWLRKMLIAATDTNSGSIAIVSMALWSAFSNDVYCKASHCPSRPISSIRSDEDSGPENRSFFRKDEYQEWMISDIYLLKDLFETAHVQENIKELISNNDDLNSLKEQERDAIDDCQNLLVLEPEEMSLIELANFITGLNKLRRFKQ
jgi:hypothetical protein